MSDNIKWKREGNSLSVKFTFPWYRRLWWWLLRRKKPTAGTGEYLFVMPTELPPGSKF